MECELKSRFSDQMNLFCGGYSEQTIEKVDVVTYIFFNTGTVANFVKYCLKTLKLL